MARQLSTRGIDLVLRLCEQRRAEIAGHVLRMHFGGVGDELIAAGALVETAPSETIFMPMDFDDQAVAFEWESDLQAHAAFHPADGWMHAAANTRRRYRLEYPWLLRLIAQVMCSRRVEQGDRALASLDEDGAGWVQMRAASDTAGGKRSVLSLVVASSAVSRSSITMLSRVTLVVTIHIAHSLVVIDDAMLLVGGPSLHRVPRGRGADSDRSLSAQ